MNCNVKEEKKVNGNRSDLTRVRMNSGLMIKRHATVSSVV